MTAKARWPIARTIIMRIAIERDEGGNERNKMICWEEFNGWISFSFAFLCFFFFFLLFSTINISLWMLNVIPVRAAWYLIHHVGTPRRAPNGAWAECRASDRYLLTIFKFDYLAFASVPLSVALATPQWYWRNLQLRKLNCERWWTRGGGRKEKTKARCKE